MSKKDFVNMSKEERHKVLFEMADEDIDFSDIPELGEEFLKTAKQVEHPLLNSTTNLIRLKPKLIQWFKINANEKGYEALINDVLENYVEHQTQQN